MHLVPFVREHLVDLAEDDEGNPGRQLVGDWKSMVDRSSAPELSWSGIHNGHLVGCGGIIPIWDGVAECWLVGGWRLGTHRLSAVRALTATLARQVKEQQLRRLQAVVRADWPAARRFARYLGMKDEGVMKQYGSDKHD